MLAPGISAVIRTLVRRRTADRKRKRPRREELIEWSLWQWVLVHRCRNRSDGSTPIESKLEEDDLGYSRPLAIVTAAYMAVRLSEKQGKLVEAALEAALDDVSGNGYVPRFVDCWTSHGALACHYGGPQDGAWLRMVVSKLKPWVRR